MSFTIAEDIANRALQHCGVPPSNRITLLTDNAKNAKECALAYNKLRLAELRRNVWRFSIKHAALRAIDTNSKIYVPLVWDIFTDFEVGDICQRVDPVDGKSRWWESLIAGNTGFDPLTPLVAGNTPNWAPYFGPVVVSQYASTTAYIAGELVRVVGTGNIYRSLVSNNAVVPSGNGDAINWQRLFGTTIALTLPYPIGAGPLSDQTTRNVFQLPYGFLREAPQDPKMGSTSFAGAPSALPYTDWLYEGNYLVSGDAGPIVFRFVADWTDVPTMDPMFCEGLAARIGYEICESITQSRDKLTTITAEYRVAMSDARAVNGIETGATEPPEDDYVTCRA